MISPNTIRRVQEEARIEEVVGEFVNLKRRGSNMLGLCPFHNEKTPSFNVSPARGIFKCFGCGKSGNSIGFLMESQQMPFTDAVKYLAAKYGITVEEEVREYSAEEEQAQQQREALLVANEFAKNWYAAALMKPEGTIGLSYFMERGLNPGIIKTFELGYAPAGWDHFYQAALEAGYKTEVLLEAGLITERNGKHFDFFRDRVIFPIHNYTGKVLGFGGRILKKDEKSPKYVNTGQTPVYNKTEVLYGLYQSRNAIRKQDECLLVEGYTDVISMHQAGIENVVASSGTALTREQIRLVRRMTKNLVILYDGDAAGIKAALRGIDLVLEEGLHVYVVLLPDGHDPDSFVRQNGASAFSDFLAGQKKDVILFRLGLNQAENASDPIKRAAFVREISATIAVIPDTLERQEYIRHSAQLLEVDEQILISEVNKQRRNRLKQTDPAGDQSFMPEPDLKPIPQAREQEFDTLRILEKDLLRVMLDYGNMQVLIGEEPVSLLAFVQSELDGIEPETPEYKALFDYMISQERAGHIYDSKFYFNHSRPEFAALSREILFTRHELSPGWAEKVGLHVLSRDALFITDTESCLIRLKQYHFEKEIKSLEKQIKECADESKMISLMQALKKMQSYRSELFKQAGTVIYKPFIRNNSKD